MLKREKVIRIGSIIFLLALSVFYGSRTVYYYMNENGFKFGKDKEYNLAELLIQKKNVVNSDNGLNKTEDGYLYVGEVNNNYVDYSGILWRVLSIDENNNLVMVSDAPLSALNFSGKYEDSDLMKWLNDVEAGVFINTISDVSVLIENHVCLDTLSEKDISDGNYACKVTNNSRKIGILDVEQYLNAGAGKSFINNGYNYWLANPADAENHWFVSSSGGLNYEDSSELILGIKATVTLDGNQLVKSGKGSKINPFIFEDKEIESLKEANVGDYINFSESLWRIVEKDEDKIKIVMDGYMDTESYRFSSKTGTYDPKDEKNIAYFLNKEFLSSLENNQYVVSGVWYNGNYNNSNFSYLTIRKKTVNAKVGMLNIGDMFVLDYPSTFTMTQDYSYTKLYTMYAIKDNYTFFADKPTGEYKIRPALYIVNDIKVEEGLGSEYNPYILGE